MLGDGGTRAGREAILACVLDALPVPVAVVTYPGLTLVYSNALSCSLVSAITGADLSETALTGHGLADVTPFFAELGLTDFLLEVGRRGRPAGQGPSEFAFRNGESRFFKLEALPIMVDGQVEYVAGLAIDVTTEVQADRQRLAALGREQTAREAAERQAAEIRALLANLNEGVTIRDGRGSLVLRNHKAAEITGVPHEEAVDVGVYPEGRYFHLDGTPIPKDQWAHRRLLRGETIVDEEFCFKRPTDDLRHLVYNGGVVKDAAGQVLLTVGTFHDVTDLRRLEAAKDQFMQVIAHELRNPLTAASGLVQLVTRGGGVGDQQRQRLAQALSELGKLGALIDDILTGYRVSAGRLPLEIREMDFLGAVREAVGSFLAGGGDEHRLAAAYSERPMVPMAGDTRRLVQVITNLLSNAAKYSPPNTTIGLTVDPGEEHVIFKVEDEGIGIPPGELEAVFQGFYRAINLPDRRSGGVGLGLFISRDIARRHGGDLWAENRPGGGTTMKLKLPLAKT